MCKCAENGIWWVTHWKLWKFRRSETLFLAFFMRYFFKKIICLEASACPVSIVTQNHSWNCDIFDDDVYDDDEKINALKTVRCVIDWVHPVGSGSRANKFYIRRRPYHDTRRSIKVLIFVRICLVGFTVRKCANKGSLAYDEGRVCFLASDNKYWTH